MAVTEVFACAKLNLSLDVLDKRPDGYHEMKMVMQTVTLAGQAHPGDRNGSAPAYAEQSGISPHGRAQSGRRRRAGLLPGDGGRPGRIRISIQIPVCAGMAGGSADAAAVLRGLNEALGLQVSQQRLEEIGALVGSDVPYCVGGGTALRRAGGKSSPPCLPCPTVRWCCASRPSRCPPRSCSKPWTAAASAAGRTPPDCWPPWRRGICRGSPGGCTTSLRTPSPNGGIRKYAHQTALIQHGALGASMSGTGSTVFGLFDRQAAAEEAFFRPEAAVPGDLSGGDHRPPYEKKRYKRAKRAVQNGVKSNLDGCFYMNKQSCKSHTLRRWELALLLGVALAALLGAWLDKKPERPGRPGHPPPRAGQFPIRRADQALKLQVRDRVLEVAESYFQPGAHPGGDRGHPSHPSGRPGRRRSGDGGGGGL